MESIIIPIGICVVMPVLIVWIGARSKANSESKRTEVLIEAIKSNASIDTDKLLSAFEKQKKTPMMVYQTRLLIGCIMMFLGIALFASGVVFESMVITISSSVCAAIGLAYLVVCAVTRKWVKANPDQWQK